MEPSKILKIVEAVLGILGTVIALVRRQFPEIEEVDEQ